MLTYVCFVELRSALERRVVHIYLSTVLVFAVSVPFSLFCPRTQLGGYRCIVSLIIDAIEQTPKG